MLLYQSVCLSVYLSLSLYECVCWEKEINTHIYVHIYLFISSISSSSSSNRADSSELPDSFATCPHPPSLLVGPLHCTQCPHRDDICKSLLVGQHWCVNVLESIRERRFWDRPHFSGNALRVLLFVLEHTHTHTHTHRHTHTH